jgi:two-component system sensor histidine kinase AtoS
MAHELRNALATMTGYLRLLADADQPERDRYVTAMQQEAGDLGTVLERFLRFAQPRELRRGPVDIARLVRERVDQLRAAFPDVPVEVHGEAANAIVDGAAVTVAIDNLLRNAAEASGASRAVVEVAVSATAERVEVRIEDRGPGVSLELEPRLFAPFTTTKASGGLGLALARRFARLHGGDVSYAPRPGGGSSFTLILPREVSG